jgi:hypothetical protein
MLEELPLRRLGTMEVADAERLKGLEAEKARLKKLVAERC